MCVNGAKPRRMIRHQGNLDGLAVSDDRGDLSGDTDRDPEADAPSAYRGTS